MYWFNFRSACALSDYNTDNICKNNNQSIERNEHANLWGIWSQNMFIISIYLTSN